MKTSFLAAALALSLAVGWASERQLFREPFAGQLTPGWSFLRENTNAWRITKEGLQVRIEPGNMWGPENSGRNVLLREAPDATEREIQVSVTVSNRPASQYEQVDLVWYYDDGNMVKVGLEQVDGKVSIVMGREENDRARTIAIIPVAPGEVELRHRVKGDTLRGFYRPAGEKHWLPAGVCSLPRRGAARIALQCYQGSRDLEHWATIKNLVVDEVVSDQ